MPTIGTRTIENLAASGGAVLAIEAGRTILLDGGDVIDLADRQGLVIAAMNDDSP